MAFAGLAASRLEAGTDEAAAVFDGEAARVGDRGDSDEVARVLDRLQLEAEHSQEEGRAYERSVAQPILRDKLGQLHGAAACRAVGAGASGWGRPVR